MCHEMTSRGCIGTIERPGRAGVDVAVQARSLSKRHRRFDQIQHHPWEAMGSNIDYLTF